MDTANINQLLAHNSLKQSTKGYQILIFLVLLLFFSFSEQTLAFDWIIRPTLNIEEVFSDNIKQASSNKKSALVTEVSPGISIRSTSSINTFDLNYRMQNLYNAGGESGIDINNQLQMNSKYEFLRNSLYMDTRSSISQQNVSNRSIASDNITGGNSSTIQTFSISPYWTPHLKSFADGEVRVTYDKVNSSGDQNQLSNSNSFSQNVRLNSGRYFSRFSWFLAFNNSEQFNSISEDVKFQNSTAEIRAFLNRDVSGFIRVGQEENQFRSTTESNKNGFFYTAGATWRPSARFSIEAGYGNNKFVTVNISPIRRIQWSTTYSNNDIGTNTGDRWQTSFNYNTRRSVWTFRYSEDTVSTQQVLLRQQSGTFEQLFGISRSDFLDQISGSSTAERIGQLFGRPSSSVPSELVDFVENQQNSSIFNVDLPTLTDEVFVSKRADLTVLFTTGKSVFNLSGFRERREFEVSQNSEDVFGFTSSWNWNFTRRSTSNIRLLWQTTEGQDATSDERFEATVGVTRNILSRLNGKVEYRYVDQQSDLGANQFSENRISASLSLRF